MYELQPLGYLTKKKEKRRPISFRGDGVIEPI